MYITRGYTLRCQARWRELLQQLQNRQHDVVHVSEAGGLRLLRVVQTARPVHADLIQTLIQSGRSVYSLIFVEEVTDGSATVHLAKVEHAVENGIVRLI